MSSNYTLGPEITAPSGKQKTDKYDKSGYPIWGFHPTKGYPVCGAFKNSAGDICLNPVRCANGRGTCHNGKSLKGSAHGRAKAGLKHSRHILALPQEAGERVKKHAQNKNLLDLGFEIALIDAQIEELEISLSNHNALETLTELAGLWEERESAGADAIPAIDARIGELVAYAAEHKATYDRINRLVEQRRKLVDSDVRRKAQAEQMVPMPMLRDYTQRVIDIYNSNLHRFIQIMASVTTDSLRSALITLSATPGRLDPAVIDVVMATAGPIIEANFLRTERRIRNETSNDILGLYGGPRVNMLPAPTPKPIEVEAREIQEPNRS